jgi:hypothetical protein
MNEADLIAAQDDQRTKRNFIAFLSGAFGVNDTSSVGQDNSAKNPPGGYQVIGQNREIGNDGMTGSNLVSLSTKNLSITPGFLLLCAGLIYMARK